MKNQTVIPMGAPRLAVDPRPFEARSKRPGAVVALIIIMIINVIDNTL